MCLAASAALVLIAPAGAAARPAAVTGKLSKPGYTVLALGAGGKAASTIARKNGRFKIRPYAKRVTLHLRKPDGLYAGPIVVGRDGKRAIVGVRAGAKLGTVKVKAGKGYAKVKKKLAEKWLDAKRTATARKGVPIGAGNFGRVRVKRLKGPSADPDLDGLPNPLDIDDDGDLVLDDNDRSSPPAASGALSSQAPPSPFHVFSRLTLSPDKTVNANAASLTDAQIDATLSSEGDLLLSILPGETAELDCGDPDTGLIYCRKNGSTGRAWAEPSAFPEYWNGSDPASFPPFPSCCDPDGDGFGTLTPLPNAPASPLPGMALRHGATTAQIGTGDVLIERVTSGGVETSYPSTQQYVFATVPALVSYSDGQGDSATLSYPIAGPSGPGAPGGPGTMGNPLPVKAGPNGDVVVTMTFWRPQRRPIAGELCPPPAKRPCSPNGWIDIGGLAYVVQFGGGGATCPQSSFSTSDPNLALPSGPSPVFSGDQGGLVDLAADQPANPADTFTYSLNLTQCAASVGGSVNPGVEIALNPLGITPNFGGVTGQWLQLKRQS